MFNCLNMGLKGMGPTTVCGQFAGYLLQTVSKLHVPAAKGKPELCLDKSWKCVQKHLKKK